MQYQQGTHLLLIDCRPYSEYAKGHIEGAINISVPSSLMLRRLVKGNVPIKNFINSDASKQKYDDRGLVEKIVLYDDSSLTENAHDNNLLAYICGKALQDHSVCVLSGGFRQFEECFPHLCQCGDGEEMSDTMFSLAKMNLNTNPNVSSHGLPPTPSPLITSNYRQNDQNTGNADKICYDNNNRRNSMSSNGPCHDSYDSKYSINSTSSTLPIQSQTLNAKDLIFRADCSGPIQIVPRLYLGNKMDATMLIRLRAANISHILNVTHDLPNVFEADGYFTYMQLPVQDNWDGNLIDLFPNAFSFIDNALGKGGVVLVHCLVGISRSSTIIIGYLMLRYGYSLNTAYDHVKGKKSNIAPNFNFMGQLQDFERTKCQNTQRKQKQLQEEQEQRQVKNQPLQGKCSQTVSSPATPSVEQQNFSLSPGSTSSEESNGSC